MMENKAFMIENFGKDESLSINGQIAEEIAQGVTRLNGENNSKECDKSKKTSWEWKYNSTSRNLVRMWWLTKFLVQLLDNLINNNEMTLVNACQNAYQTGFAEHHPWLVRKGAGLAMMAAGQKDALIQKWGVASIEEARPCFEKMTILRDNLDALLTSNDLKGLP